MFREIDADLYVMVDGDDTYPAEFVHKLIEPVVNEEADMTIGDRLSNGTYQQEIKKNFHEFGNNIVRGSINLLFNCKLKDIMTGYRVFSRTFVKNMPVMSPNFELETEMTLFALDKRFRIKEIPIVFKTIIKMFKDFKPRQFFWISALIIAIIGLIIGVPVIVEFAKTGYITKVPSAILATGIMTIALIIAQCGVILDTVVKQNRENYELQLLRYLQNEKNNK